MAEMTSEKHVKARVKKLLDKHDWFWWCPPANGYGTTGVSDFNALKNGVFLAIETKFDRNKPTLRQKGYAESIWAQKGIAFCVNETHLEWLEAWLKCFDNATHAVVLAGADTRPEDAINQEDGATMLNAVAELTELWK